VTSPDARWFHSLITEVGKYLIPQNPPSTAGNETTHDINTFNENSLGKVFVLQRMHVVNLSNDLDICV
jgi:hypothetical protein